MVTIKGILDGNIATSNDGDIIVIGDDGMTYVCLLKMRE